MKLALTVLIMTSSLLVFGQEKTSFKSDTPSVEQTLIQIEHEWNKALMAKDYKAIDRIVADDWVGVDFKGMTTTKHESIAELKAGESSNQSVEVGDMTVRVFGNTAVVIGTDTEKSTYQGKDSSGKYAWMDVFMKRAGKWQAVASQSTKLVK